MMLEDLYVRTSERRRGVGDKLFNAVANVSAIYIFNIKNSFIKLYNFYSLSIQQYKYKRSKCIL